MIKSGLIFRCSYTIKVFLNDALFQQNYNCGLYYSIFISPQFNFFYYLPVSISS